MDWFETVRAQARALRARTLRGRQLTSTELVRAASNELDVELFFVPPDHPQLNGARATYDAQSNAICCARGGTPAETATLVAHEIGHVCLDHASTNCSNDDVDVSQAAELAPIGLQRVEDYGQRERRELRANVFARELLLSHEEARRLYLDEGLSSEDIADRLVLPPSLVRQQLLDALLLPAVEAARVDVDDTPSLARDPSQDRAAVQRDKPFLLQAGPGTGKTRTLIERVTGLLEEKNAADSIAIMTFSNRAAGELYERLARTHATASASIWIGTFHAFGLDLLRRYHDKLELPANPVLFDRSDGISMLEELLPTLELRHYRDLWNPARELREMLGAISRAKDELVNSAQYEQLAMAMLASAKGEEERKAAEKALEVARVYRCYETGLREHGAVDFGDLIMRPTLLLEHDASVRAAVGLRHRHILVDEYQDMNRASARLLKALVGAGKRLWVVGDSRQSIYRFRGASSANMKRFETDFPGGATDQLSINYRSTPEIVAGLLAIAPHMAASDGLLPLQFASQRASVGARPELLKVQTPGHEIQTVIATIRELVSSGVPHRNQAVLCRTNAKLAEFAQALERSEIPVLHLGSIFERDEIRDLLALLTLISDRRGDALVRIGQMPRYGLSLEDVQLTLAWLRAESSKPDPKPAASRLADAADEAGISADGRDSLRRIAADLAGFDAGSSPWEVLTTFLLDRSRLAVGLATSASVSERLRAVAVWQFLNFTRQSVPGTGTSRIRRLLNRVRMMVLLAEERDLRRVPAGALHMDAVRLLTVHASKGLEFEVVHIPGMTKSSFPSNRRGQICPPPRGLIEGVDDVAEASARAHDEEEECLFFVATSRARTQLYLYAAAKQANGNNRMPSPYLAWLSGHIVERASTANTVDAGPGVEALAIAWDGRWPVSHHALISFEKCPRRFLYTHLLDLGTARSHTAYSQAQACLFDVIRWCVNERAIRDVGEQELLDKSGEIWRAKGPVDHGFAADYLRIVERLVCNLAASADGLRLRPSRGIELDLRTGELLVEPDELGESPDGVRVLRRIRPGYRRSKEEGLEYDLLDLAGRSLEGPHVVQAVHLGDGMRETIEIGDKRRRNKDAWTRDALAEIRAGVFRVEPDDYECPKCPHFFVCPTIPKGTLTPPAR